MRFSMYLFSFANRVRYCRLLEEGPSFRGRSADFFTMILFGASLMLMIAPFRCFYFLNRCFLSSAQLIDSFMLDLNLCLGCGQLGVLSGVIAYLHDGVRLGPPQ
jgi:hypothetical protein